MSLFRDTVDKIKSNKANHDAGKVNCIPFEWMPRLRNVLPGIVEGTNWIVTASSGVGKTQFTKHNFVYEPIKWVKNNPNKGVKIKVLYFALEESKEEFMISMISNRLYHQHGISIDPLSLMSMYEKGIDDDILEKIEECEEYFKDFAQYIDIVDSISNPTGIYKYIRNYSYENGTHYYYNFKDDKEKKNTIPHEEYHKLTDTKNWAYSHYIPNDPDEYVICIVDHFSLLQPEKTDDCNTLHKAMTKMSGEYGRKNVTKHWGYVFVNVQQQAAEGEKSEFTKMGDKIEEKFKPSLANLGDNKLTQRDAFVVLGVFSPARHGIKKYNGYDTGRMGDKFRTAEVLKNRLGKGYVEVPLFFNGAVNNLKELPKVEEMNESIYKMIDNI